MFELPQAREMRAVRETKARASGGHADARLLGPPVAVRDAPLTRSLVTDLGTLFDPAAPTRIHRPFSHGGIIRRNGASTRALGLASGDPEMEVPTRGQRTRVTGDLGRCLQAGSHAILFIKLHFLPHGSGNVEQSIAGSKSAATTHLNAFRKMFFLQEGQQPISVGDLTIDSIHSPAQIVQAAICAAAIQGGNCLQNGQIAFAILRLMLPNGTPLALVKPSGVDHAFTVIGDVPASSPVTEDMAAQMVCVDAWPHIAKACLLSDSVFGTWDSAKVVRGQAIGPRSASEFYQAVAAQTKMLKAFAESTTVLKDRDERTARNSIRSGLRILGEHQDREPTEADFKEQHAYGQLTVFEDDEVPLYDIED